jgi:hypothetical protein
MGVFDFFKSGRYEEKPATQSLPEIDEKVFIEPKPAEPIVLPATDNNIMLLYGFLDRNHEVKGYDDALLNPDTSHMDQNLEALKNELVRTINKVKTFYCDFIQETDFHILSRSRSGMVDIVEELEMKKKIALGHLERVTEIEEKAGKEEGDGQGILLSYARGFKNGLAAISHHHILTRRF